MAAFRLFKLILFASMNFKLEPNAVNKVEFVAFSVVESNLINPLLLFFSQASWVASRFPFNFIVEFNFPLMIPAIGRVFQQV
jgi:hypothetical protein